MGIMNHNIEASKGNVNYRLEVGKFADRTAEEMKHLRCLKAGDSKRIMSSRNYVHNLAIELIPKRPDYLNWTAEVNNTAMICI